ncbi:DUF2155 domain-containing protein [Pelagibacteraceae bacterium]|nr:DUF2155 domain-containing protein [Pelagibacteraceae bacterium]
MKPGSTKLILSIFLLFFYSFPSQSEDKILSSPLINLKKLKPSFEGIDNSTNDTTDVNKIKNRIEILPKNNTLSAKLIGLDKITAKTLEITVNLGEIKKFGPLEIKILKCGKIELDNKDVSVAYLQVKDFTENQNEKIFIFNGWTFSSDPTIAPFDHAIYDLQLVNCNNA